jgi:hypothetical protein
LALDDDDDDDDDQDEEDENDIDVDKIRDGTLESLFEKPNEPKEEINIEILINGDDRFQACALLSTMDDYMGVVHQHYELLKNHLCGQQVLGQQPPTTESATNKKDEDDDDNRDAGILKLLMECTVVANMVTESVKSAENSLYIDHPHISSFYHVLMIVFLPSFIVEVEDFKQDNRNNNGNKQPESHSQLDCCHTVIDFVAKIVESAFHNNSNPAKATGNVKGFARKIGIKSKAVLLEHSIAPLIFVYDAIQNRLAIDESYNGVTVIAEMTRATTTETTGIFEAYSWLKRSSSIGGDSCILNTQHLIQKVLVISKTNSKLVSRTSFGGLTFDEETNPAARIREDLDEIFAGSILPELIKLCMQDSFERIPHRSHLLTMIDLFQAHIKKDWTAPVPLSVSFSFHALLTSMFVLQVDKDLARIASIMKQSCSKLFSQLDTLSEPSNDPKNTPFFYKNVGMYKQIASFAKPVPIPYDQFKGQSVINPIIVERSAFWKPLIGGEC